jgi:hypothetical protein
MAQPLSVTYKGFKGINNIDSSHRLSILKGNATYLKDAVNCNIDKTGAIETREGTTQIWNHSTHSLYTNGIQTLGVVADNLSIIDPSAGWSHETIYSGVGDSQWYYVSIGDTIYASNGTLIGYVTTFWHNFPTSTQLYKKTFPACTNLEYYKSRMYGSIDNLVIFSDPMWFISIDERNDKSYVQRPSTITMIKAVDDGLWVSDQHNILFFKGNSPTEFTMEYAKPYGIIPGTSSTLPASVVIDKELWHTPVIATTSEGVVIMGDGGKIKNLTEGTYSIPPISKGVSCITRGRINQYVSIVK